MFNVPCRLCKKLITQENQEKTGDSAIVSVAKMVNDKAFTYGISGLFEFQCGLFPPEIMPKKGDSICNTCLKAHRKNIKPHLIVKCSVCGELHQACWEDDKSSGWGCSGHVRSNNKKLQIECGWGSSHDCDTFAVKRRGKLKSRQTVCDKCIKSFLKSGRIQKEKIQQTFVSSV